MFRNLSVILKIGNIWEQNFSGVKCPEENCSGWKVMEAKQPEDKMSLGWKTGDKTLGGGGETYGFQKWYAWE